MSVHFMRLRHHLRRRVHAPATRFGAVVAGALILAALITLAVISRSRGAQPFLASSASVRTGTATGPPTSPAAEPPAPAVAPSAAPSPPPPAQVSAPPGLNRIPTWDATTSNIVQSVDPGNPLLALVATDPDSDQLSYGVSGGAFPGTVLLHADGSFAGTAFTAGTYRAQVTATDGSGAAATTVVEVTVRNSAPKFSSTASNTAQRVVAGTPLVGLTATDANAEPLTFSLRAGTLPPGVTLEPSGTFTGVAELPGIYVAELTAVDPSGVVASTKLTVTVRPSAVPTSTAPTSTTPTSTMPTSATTTTTSMPTTSMPTTSTTVAGTIAQ